MIRLIDPPIKRLSYVQVEQTISMDCSRQRNDESLNAYYNRIQNLIKVIESRWDNCLLPTKLAEDQPNNNKKEKKA